MLHVRRIERREEFASMRAEWNALLDTASPRAFFLRHEWLHTWFTAYGAERRPVLLAATRGGGLQAVLPLCAWTDRFAGLPMSRLDFMANGHSPLADLVVRPGAEPEATAAFAAFLQDAENWDLAVFPEVEANAPLAHLATHFAPQAQLVQPQRQAPYIPVTGSWENFHATLSKNFVRSLRNNRNRIARQGGATVELLTEPGAITAALPDMFAISERSWQGAAGSGVGSTAANRTFYSGLVRELAPLGVLRLWFFLLAGRRVAFEFHVVQEEVEFGLKTGFDRDYETLGPGKFLDQHIVEHLFRAGRVREYDLVGDADTYKLRWTSHTRPFVRWTLFGRGARARMLSRWHLEMKPVLKHVRALGRGAGTQATGAAGTSQDEPGETS
jgi:CelD/BcsL family acetyltransferase involved in cellulose biosynthesis